MKKLFFLLLLPLIATANVTMPIVVTTSPINVSVTQTRGESNDTCAIPCGVFFDATGTTSTATSFPFHEILYTWNFGDGGCSSGNTNWVNGSTTGSRNVATGPLAAHIYECAGTFTVTATMNDGTSTASTTRTVTAVSADTVFSGKTFCVAAATTPVAGVGGCPAGATAVGSQPNFKTAIDNNIGAGNVRILFKCGDTFTASATTAVGLSKTSPGIIGAYPLACANRPIVQMTGNVDVLNSGANDWRYMDIEFDLQSGNAARAFHPAATTGIQQVYLRNFIHHGFNGMTFSQIDPTQMWNQIFIQDTTIQNILLTAGGYGIFGGMNRSAIMGNSVSLCTTGQHNIRIEFANKLVVSNNSLSDPGTSGTANLKIHSSKWAQFGVPTQYVYISDNLLKSTAANWQFELVPENSVDIEHLADFIIERNQFIPGAGYNSPEINLTAQNVTIRNNLVDMTNNSGQTGFAFTKSTVVGEPDNDHIWIYDNSFFSNAVFSGGRILIINDAPTMIFVKNNMAYAPNWTSTTKMFDATPGTAMNNVAAAGNTGGCTTTADCPAIRTTAPPFTTTPPVVTTDWKPTVANPQGITAVTVPVWSDFFGITEPPRDIGAVIH